MTELIDAVRLQTAATTVTNSNIEKVLKNTLRFRKKAKALRAKERVRRKAAEGKTRVKDAKQTFNQKTFEVVTGGVVIVSSLFLSGEDNCSQCHSQSVFLAATNIALLSYASNFFSNKFPGQPTPRSADFPNTCWTVSLIIVLFVAFVDGLVGFLLSLQTIAVSMYKMGVVGKSFAPLGYMDKRFKKFKVNPPNGNTQSAGNSPTANAHEAEGDNNQAAGGDNHEAVGGDHPQQTADPVLATAQEMPNDAVSQMDRPLSVEAGPSARHQEIERRPSSVMVLGFPPTRSVASLRDTSRDMTQQTVHQRTVPSIRMPSPTKSEDSLYVTAQEDSQTASVNAVRAPSLKSYQDEYSSVESWKTRDESVYTESLDDTKQYKVPTQYSILSMLTKYIGCINALAFLAVIITNLGIAAFVWIGQPMIPAIIVSIVFFILFLVFVRVAYRLAYTRLVTRNNAETGELGLQFPNLYNEKGELNVHMQKFYIAQEEEKQRKLEQANARAQTGRDRNESPVGNGLVNVV